MQYYNEDKMKNIRVKLEKEILGWPEVTTKKMYGCPCYKYNQKLFAFLVTDGVVLTKTDDRDKEKLAKDFMVKPFQAATRTMKGWLQIPLDETSDIKKIIPYIKNCYQHAKTEDSK
jgi:TfoX N-terminal domain